MVAVLAALTWCADASAYVPGKDGAATITTAATVINTYTTLSAAAGAGAPSITLASVAGIGVGDVLLLYNAQGATISSANDASYGTVTALGNAGHFEMVNVVGIAGTTVTIQSGDCDTAAGLRFGYNSGAEAVRIPQYTTLTISGAGSITALPWNGSTGGIVGAIVSGTASIGGAGINVAAQGFRGGALINIAGGSGTDWTYYVNNVAANGGGEKGESIAGYQAAYDAIGGRYGRGAPANGGGGGNSHNAAGGGGSNGDNGVAWTGEGNPDNSVATYSTAWDIDGTITHTSTSSGGGRGGYTYASAVNDPTVVAPGAAAWSGNQRRERGGIGGRPLTNDPSSVTGRVFFGGGGGAGDENNGAGTPGGNGGGLVFLIADTINGAAAINANGAAVPTNGGGGNDGSGGGGGGGSIVLISNALSGVGLSANGGIGGSQAIVGNESEGPGGGGGGGYIAVRGGAAGSSTAAAGANGVTNSAAVLPNFPPNGATRGATGISGAAAPTLGNFPICAVLPQLTVTKTATPNPFVVGQPGSYAISVVNNGSGPTLAPIVITDTLPTGITPTSVTGAGWSCTGTTALTCTFSGTLEVGASTTLTLNVAVAASATTADNTATATGGGDSGCPAATRCVGTVVVPVVVIVSADLSITKTDGSTTYTPGSVITYTIVASNAGPNAVTGANVVDTLPASLTGATWTALYAGGATGPASGSGNINVSVNFPAGSSATFTVSATVASNATGSLGNTATITAPPGITDPNLANNSATDTDTLAASADIAVSKTGTTSVGYGGALTWSVVVRNNGPSDANGSPFSDAVPAGVTAVTASCGSATGGAVCGGVNVAGNNVTSTITTLPSGGSVTFTINGTAPTSGTTISNTASANPPAGTTDPNPGNNSSTATTTLLTPQLHVTKTATPNPFVVGEAASYAITVTNSGTGSTFGNITVADTLPAGITFVSATGTNWTCSGTTTLSCIFSGTLAANASTTLTLNVSVAASATAADNTATATGGGDPACPAAARCVGTVVVPVSAAADIAVAKIVDNASPNVGDNVTFTITATNNGPSDATGVQITDALPSGLAFVSSTPSQGTYASASGLWSVGALVNGASATLQITATVLNPGDLTNTATRTGGDQIDPDPSNNSASASINALPSADLQVLKTVDNATPDVGANVTFTITLTNGGPDDATGVALDDLLPAGLSFVAATPQQGTYDEATGIWTVGSIANGVSLTLTITATVTQTGDITNTASVAASDQHDPNLGNNSGGATINGQSADIQVIKTVDNANPTRGDTVTFTITTTNNGPSNATGVAVTDPLPAGLVFVSATPSQGTFDQASGVWTIGNLDASGAGATVTLTIVATVDTDSGFTNTATVSASDQPDPNPANNVSSVVVTPIGSADVAVLKTGPATATAGGQIVYALSVVNNGPSPASGVTLDDPSPAGLTFVSATAPCAGGFPCDLGNLAVGESVTVTVTFDVGADATGDVVNTATVSSTTADPDPTNNTSSATTTLNAEADVSAVKTGPAAVNASGAIVYTVVVSNAGPSDVDGATFSDPVPAGITGVTATCGSPTGGAVCGAVTVAADNTVTSTITTLPSAGSVTFTISGTAPAAATTLSNTASVDPPAGVTDPDPTNNDSTVGTNVVVPVTLADLVVVKTGPASVTAGDVITYSILVSNNGPGAADGANFVDPVPASITALTASCGAPTGGAACGAVGVGADNTVTSTLAAMPSGGSVTFTISGIAPDIATTLGNTASVAPPAGVTDPDPGNNTSTVSTNVVVGVLSADLSVAKSGPATVVAGSTVVYTIVVSNGGPDAASNVIVSDTTPAGLVFVGNGGACTTAYPCAIGSLASGGSATITSTYSVPANYGGANPIVNTASVASDTPDPNLANNTASASTAVTLPAQSADLVVTKRGPPTVVAGSAITFTITVTNLGPDGVTDAVLDDPTPAGLTFVAASAPCGAGFPCALGAIASGASVAVTTSYTVAAGATGAIVNVADANSPTVPDPDPNNNSSTVTTTIVGGGGPGAPQVPVPVDARWALLLLGVVLMLAGARRSAPRRPR